MAPALMVGEPRYKKPKYIAEKRLRSFPTVEAMPELNNLADLRPDQRWPIFQVALLNLSHSRGKNIQPLQQGLFRAYAQIRERQKSALAGSSDENILPKAVSPVEFQRLLTELRIFFSEQGKVTGRFHWDFLTAEGLVHFLGLSDLLTLNRWMRAWFTVTEKGRTTVSHRASATWVRRVFDHTQSRLELTARLTNYRSEARQLAVSFLEENFWEVPLSQRRRVYGIFRSIVKRSDDPALSARAFEAMRDAYPYLHHLDRYWALKNLAEDWVLYYRNPNFRSVPVSWGSLSHRLGPRELEKLVRFFGNHLGDPAPRIKENAQLALKDMIKYSQKHGKPS
ncbi:MAG: hypothetical protein R3257_05530 [bacterium]|nr:hypothetical protein [bacterium]